MPMKPARLASRMVWPRSDAELVELQIDLAARRPPPWRPPAGRPLTAGCFVCFAPGVRGRGRAGEPAFAAAALMRANRGLVATVVVIGEAGWPYQPGFLALREGPVLEAAVKALPQRPEVLIVNAGGRDHPRGAGVALHLGAALELPSVGVTDRPLLAEGPPPGAERGTTSPLMLDGSEVARSLRTRAGARPVVVHPGWRTDLDTAVAVTAKATRRARTPEPLRRARAAARAARAGGTDRQAQARAR
jgi:deoxyribonuclease V